MKDRDRTETAAADQYDWFTEVVGRISPIMNDIHELYMNGGWEDDPRRRIIEMISNGLGEAFNASYLLMHPKINPAYQEQRHHLKDPISDEGIELRQESLALEADVARGSADTGVPA